MNASVVSVSRNPSRGLRKPVADEIHVLAGLGVEGDVHAGREIRHLARMRKDPTKPNLRQVHLIHAELHDTLAAAGMPVAPGDMGENITTRGIDLLELSAGTRLAIGADAVLEVTGLRNPCVTLDQLHEGLMEATLERLPDGELRRKAGIMSVVRTSGAIRVGDPIRILAPPAAHSPLVPV